MATSLLVALFSLLTYVAAVTTVFTLETTNEPTVTDLSMATDSSNQSAPTNTLLVNHTLTFSSDNTTMMTPADINSTSPTLSPEISALPSNAEISESTNTSSESANSTVSGITGVTSVTTSTNHEPLVVVIQLSLNLTYKSVYANLSDPGTMNLTDRICTAINATVGLRTMTVSDASPHLQECKPISYSSGSIVAEMILTYSPKRANLNYNLEAEQIHATLLADIASQNGTMQRAIGASIDLRRLTCLNSDCENTTVARQRLTSGGGPAKLGATLIMVVLTGCATTIGRMLTV